ncbi:MAG TPA: hypothetical protein VF593_12370 [Chthoniobacteraceae bacterium]|jgi:hypothetical protein
MIFRVLPLVALLLAAPIIGRSAAAPNLVPANFQQQTDSLGFIWDLDSNGSVQNGSNCFSGAMQVEVNGSSFSAQQPMMTPDGSEYFIDANINNSFAINRRVKLEQKAAFVRYVDTLRNISAAPQTVRLNFRIQFNNQMQATIGDSGAPVTNALGAKDSGFAVLRPPGQQGASALVLVSGRNAKLRPTIQNQRNYQFNLTYNLKLAPGESVSLVHALAQRGLNAAPDAKALAKLFAPLNSSRLVADVPPRDRKMIVNFAPGSFGSSPSAPVLTSLLEKLNVERGPVDVLAIGADTRLKGTASCARLEIASARGKTVIPLEKIAALIGDRRETRVLLRDGQTLRGKLTAEGLKFALTTGTTIALDAAALDRLVLRALPGEVPGSAGAWGFVETFEGERLAVKADANVRLRATTAWGVRELALDEVLGCGPTEEDPLGFRVVLKDGSSFVAFLDGDEMTFETSLFGQQKFAPSEIRQIAATPPKVAVEENLEAPPERAQVVVAGGQILAGQIDLPELHFLSSAGVIPVASNLIRTLSNSSAEASEATPVFTATLWGGGTVGGSLREFLVPVRTAGSVFQVPVRDLVSAAVPSPAMPEGLRDKIAALLRDLGHADWEKREAASRELGELGSLTRSALDETVKQTTDAEVRRRAQTLLDTIETL